MAREKTEVAEKKLAAVSKLEGELKKLKQERAASTSKVKDLTTRVEGLERYLGSFAKKMYEKLEGIFFPSFAFA